METIRTKEPSAVKGGLDAWINAVELRDIYLLPEVVTQDAADIALTGSIPGAINISLGSLTYKADHELPEEWRDARLNDQTMLIVTTCATGQMGALGGKLLQDMGFTNVYILDGGVQAWVEAGYPVEPPA